MKKWLFLLFSLALIITSLSACNKTIVDTTYSFDRAVIKMPDNVAVEVDVASWTDYEDGDHIQVKTKEGKIYLVHSSNIVLIKD